MCAKKIYDTNKQAVRARKAVRQRGQKGLKIYYCAECQGWHLGRPRRKRKFGQRIDKGMWRNDEHRSSRLGVATEDGFDGRTDCFGSIG